MSIHRNTTFHHQSGGQAWRKDRETADLLSALRCGGRAVLCGTGCLSTPVDQCTLREREARIGLPAARFAGQAARVPLLKVTAVGEDGLEVRSSFATSRSVTTQRETRQRGEPHSRGGPHESLRATPQQSFLNSLTLSNHPLTPFIKSPESSNPARSTLQFPPAVSRPGSPPLPPPPT